jgi:hypothetical protein
MEKTISDKSMKTAEGMDLSTEMMPMMYEGITDAPGWLQ